MIITLLSLIFLTDELSENAKEKYIDKWTEIAIVESQRTGIPASIILGQAILESSYGRSELATSAKNHFGIKCKKAWTGSEYFTKDDDIDKSGKLIKSCFRSYEIALDSFIDHSHFLTSSLCYRTLQDYSTMEYKKWAKGLQECGYATDRRYSQKLIKYIEYHELWRLDNGLANHD